MKMVRISKKRRIHKSLLTVHWTILGVLLTLAALTGTLTLLRLKDDKMNGTKILAAAISANTIQRSGKPYIMYGTAWKKERTSPLVSEAIHAGFRFIDTACQPKHYNEAGVGDGWIMVFQELGLTRADLFFQTKFTPVDGQDPERIPYDINASLEDQVKQSVYKSLSNLHVSYIDSLVLHSPLRSMDDTIRVWRVFESFVDSGTVKQLGISNCYHLPNLSRLYREARIKPSVLQNRFYADSNFDTELRKFCNENNMLYQSFWTLGANRHALDDPEIHRMAESKGLTPQTLMYAFMMSLGHIPLSGTTNSEHMLEDVAVMERIQGGEKIFEDESELTKMASILGMPGL